MTKGGPGDLSTHNKKPAASSKTAEAFKGYLEKAAPNLSAKDFQEGAPIPTNQIDFDINVITNQISKYGKFGFPTDEKEKQLDALQKLKNSAKGKSWPTATQKLKSNANKAYQQSECGHKSFSATANAQGQIFYICKQCCKTWVEPAPAEEKGVYAGLGYLPLSNSHKKYVHKKAEFDWTKKVTGYEKPVPTTSKNYEDAVLRVGGRYEVNQNMLMRMGILSDCNVTIQHRIGAGYLDEFRLICSKCSYTEVYDTSILLNKVEGVPAKIADFCKAHKHSATVQATEGRVFIEE